MKTLVLNTVANPTEDTKALLQKLKEKGTDITIYNTYEMNIKHCIGCNFCWLKTPGICTIKDDYEILLQEILKHDELVIIADMKLGFVTHETKKLFDRILPVATMYLQFKDGQMRHVSRYDKQLKLALFYQGTCDEEYINYWLYRAAMNLEWESLGACTTTEGKEKVKCI